MPSLAKHNVVLQVLMLADAARPCLSYRFSFDPALAWLRVYDTSYSSSMQSRDFKVPRRLESEQKSYAKKQT